MKQHIARIASNCFFSITCAGYDKLDVLLAKKSHHSSSQCLFCPDLTTVIHCWPAYHLLLSNLYKEFRTQLFVWYLTSLPDHATPGLQQLHWLPVEHRITFKLCMLMHLIHIGRVPRYMADSVQSIVESSRRPGLRSADTADYVKHRLQSKFGERCFSYAGPAAWNSLPHSIKLITDTSRFKQLLWIWIIIAKLLRILWQLASQFSSISYCFLTFC